MGAGVDEESAFGGDGHDKPRLGPEGGGDVLGQRHQGCGQRSQALLKTFKGYYKRKLSGISSTQTPNPTSLPLTPRRTYSHQGPCP